MPLLRYCTGIVGPARAEDAVQHALINAHEALKRTSEVRHLRSWLYRIAHNAALNVLRAVRDDVPLETTEIAVGAGPDEAYERAERLRETLAAVQDLPERQRAALLLRELEGRSHEEIAAALGVTKGSARQSLMRARASVRAAVTAITPYPLIAKLSSVATHPSMSSGWGETAATAGAGATLAKVTAGIMATGALVGGAAGTHVLTHHEPATSKARPAVAAPRSAGSQGGQTALTAGTSATGAGRAAAPTRATVVRVTGRVAHPGRRVAAGHNGTALTSTTAAAAVPATTGNVSGHASGNGNANGRRTSATGQATKAHRAPKTSSRGAATTSHGRGLPGGGKTRAPGQTGTSKSDEPHGQSGTGPDAAAPATGVPVTGSTTTSAPTAATTTVPVGPDAKPASKAAREIRTAVDTTTG